MMNLIANGNTCQLFHIFKTSDSNILIIILFGVFIYHKNEETFTDTHAVFGVLIIG